VENGTAPNALALGGKPPEYYLPAVNLLDNPDFAIAQAGYNGLHGAEKYAADRWITSATDATLAGPKIMRMRGGQYTSSLDQKIDVSSRAGQPLTIAGKVRGTLPVGLVAGFSYDENGNLIEMPQKSQQIAKDSWTLIVLNVTVPANAYTLVVGFNNPSDDDTNYYEVTEPVCYPGTYTAETLPLFVPPKSATELAECKYYYQGERKVQTVGSYDAFGKSWYVTLPIEQEMRKPDNQNAPSVIVSNIRWVGIDPAIVTFYSQQPSYTYSYYAGDQRGVTIQIVFDTAPIASVHNCGHGYIFLTYELNSDL
jgi:hypothetical protein